MEKMFICIKSKMPLLCVVGLKLKCQRIFPSTGCIRQDELACSSALVCSFQLLFMPTSLGVTWSWNFFWIWRLNYWNHKHLHLIKEHNSTIRVWVWINLWVILDSPQNTSSRWSFHDRVSAHTWAIKPEWSWCCPGGTSGASFISPSLRSLSLFANVGPRTSLRFELRRPVLFPFNLDLS